jgi:hypothetical protein
MPLGAKRDPSALLSPDPAVPLAPCDGPAECKSAHTSSDADNAQGMQVQGHALQVCLTFKITGSIRTWFQAGRAEPSQEVIVI